MFLKFIPPHHLKLLPGIFIVLLIFACSPPKSGTAKELSTLADLQKQEQAAHLQEEPAILVNMLNDTLVQIKNGEVTSFTKDQMTSRFMQYFDAVEFIKWEDSQPPVYAISDDGTMAHVLIRKHVEVSIETDTTPTREITDFAWTELWKKKDGRWKMYVVTSTESVRE